MCVGDGGCLFCTELQRGGHLFCTITNDFVFQIEKESKDFSNEHMLILVIYYHNITGQFWTGEKKGGGGAQCFCFYTYLYLLIFVRSSNPS